MSVFAPARFADGPGGGRRASRGARGSRGLPHGGELGDGVDSTAEAARTRRRIHPLILAYYFIVVSTAFLLVLGLIMVLSSSSIMSIDEGHSVYYFVVEQTIYALLGLVGAWICSRLPLVAYKRLAWPALFVAFAVQLLVFVPGLGVSLGGSRNWIRFGGLSLQPSEFVKLALAVWLGVVLALKRPHLREWKHVVVPCVLVSFLAIGTVMVGGDLGTSLVMVLLVLGAFLIAGISAKYLVTGFLFTAAIGFLAVASSAHRLARFKTLLGLTTGGALSTNWQIDQASYGMALGGLTGVGLGASREKWGGLSQADSDFIFAIIGEELGLLGTLLVLALFTVLIIGMMQVVLRQKDFGSRVIAGAITCWIGGQALINIGMVIGVLPVIGVPLPFISAGGSALISSLMAIGVMVSIIRSDPEAGSMLRGRPRLLPGHFGVFAPSGGRATPTPSSSSSSSPRPSGASRHSRSGVKR